MVTLCICLAGTRKPHSRTAWMRLSWPAARGWRAPCRRTRPHANQTIFRRSARGGRSVRATPLGPASAWPPRGTIASVHPPSWRSRSRRDVRPGPRGARRRSLVPGRSRSMWSTIAARTAMLTADGTASRMPVGVRSSDACRARPGQPPNPIVGRRSSVSIMKRSSSAGSRLANASALADQFGRTAKADSLESGGTGTSAHGRPLTATRNPRPARSAVRSESIS